MRSEPRRINTVTNDDDLIWEDARVTSNMTPRHRRRLGRARERVQSGAVSGNGAHPASDVLVRTVAIPIVV